jgi:hypothetical protein
MVGARHHLKGRCRRIDAETIGLCSPQPRRGSHFDDEVRDPGYLSLAGSSNALVFRPGHEPQLVFAAELATMRQVAWELTKTLADAQF